MFKVGTRVRVVRDPEFHMDPEQSLGHGAEIGSLATITSLMGDPPPDDATDEEKEQAVLYVAEIDGTGVTAAMWCDEFEVVT